MVHSSTIRHHRPAPPLLGPVVAMALPLVYTLWVGPLIRPYLGPVFRPDMGSIPYELVGLAVMWGTALGVLAYVRGVERRPLASIGLRPPTLRNALVTVGIGILLCLAVPALAVIAAGLTGSELELGMNYYPAWIVLAGVLTAAFTEETIYRGYALERLGEAAGRPWPVALVPLAAFFVLHLPAWSLVHSLGVVLPLGLALTLFYLWRRNLVLVIIAHLIIDLPLLFMALRG